MWRTAAGEEALYLIASSFEIKPNHKESVTQWGTPETTRILNLEYTAWLTSPWTPSLWFKLVLASQNGEWLCLFLPDFLRVWFLLNRNSLLLAQDWSKTTVVFCFLRTSFCIHLVVLPWICERHSALPQNIIKRTGSVFLTSDFCSYGEHRQWGQWTMNTWW